MNKEELEQKIKTLLLKISGHSDESDINKLVEMSSLSLDVRELQEAIVVLKHLNANPVAQDSVIEEVEEETAPVSKESETEKSGGEDSAEEEIDQTELATETMLENSDQSVGEQSINDRLESHGDANSVANQLEGQSIENLKNAIGINEKFLFTKELFNNDSTAYASAIDKLDEFGTLDEAISYINSDLKPAYTWDDESEAVISLLSLIEKRYSA